MWLICQTAFIGFKNACRFKLLCPTSRPCVQLDLVLLAVENQNECRSAAVQAIKHGKLEWSKNAVKASPLTKK